MKYMYRMKDGEIEAKVFQDDEKVPSEWKDDPAKCKQKKIFKKKVKK